MFGKSLEEVSKESQSDPYDCLIVGGGTSGLTFAQFLARVDRRILIVEAGGFPLISHIVNSGLRYSPSFVRSVRSQFQYSPTLNRTGKFGSNYACVGGRGLFWNGAAPRYAASDFKDWPISYSDLRAHYQWVEREFRVTNGFGQTRLSNDLISRCRRRSFPAVPGAFAAQSDVETEGSLASDVGSGLESFLHNSADAMAAGNIDLCKSAVVDKLLLESSICRGVQAQAGNQMSEIYARSVVIAARGTESIRVVLRSDVSGDFEFGRRKREADSACACSIRRSRRSSIRYRRKPSRSRRLRYGE